MIDPKQVLEKAATGHRISNDEAISLASYNELPSLLEAASRSRDRGHGSIVTYSPKVFIPLTQLCRDVCHYCTFAQTPRNLEKAYLRPEEILEIARAGVAAGCHEALFTLGDKPELRYSIARKELKELGYPTTIAYLAAMAKLVYEETGLLPHVNPGVLSRDELAELRKVAVSQGIMLESGSQRLCEKGMPHYGSPDKNPVVRLGAIAAAGAKSVPMTSGILVGIGETRLERIEALLALRDLDDAYGHVQEVIIQNFRAKPGTKMHAAPEPDLNELLWTIAIARLILGAEASVQAPPNLSPQALPEILNAGINDWGGISPVTPDHVNPEAPWPHLEVMARATESVGKQLVPRLTIYPRYIEQMGKWVDEGLQKYVLDKMDSSFLARTDNWTPGSGEPVPKPGHSGEEVVPLKAAGIISPVQSILNKATGGKRLAEKDIASLFETRGREFDRVCAAANELRKAVNGDVVSYVVNRNINYTNICYFKCQFCAFSKGRTAESLRGKGYDLPLEEVQQRCCEAWQRGATEVCLQGGIHPSYTGQTYLDITRAIKQVLPDMHIHAFSALEISQGAETLGIPVREFLLQLKEAGLGTLPGTAAEVLDDEVRTIICPDKLTTAQWFDIIRTAHEVGLRTTSTIMFGHIDRPIHWARHLLGLRELQEETGGFTEFVPLPYVHMEAPLYRKGRSRRGPTFREAVLMHAVGRLALYPHINNIQTSWVKMGIEGVKVCLDAGVNDLGGTLMNESISRAAGASHGQELSPGAMETLIRETGRAPRERTTLYGDLVNERKTDFDELPASAVTVA
jgi:FO synthase